MANEQHQEAAIDALDRFWDARQAGRDHDYSPNEFDPGLSATVAALHRLPDAVGPDPAFVRRLERELLSQVPATEPGARQPTPIARWGLAPGQSRRGRGVLRVAEVLAAAVLIALIGGGLLISRGLWLPERTPPTEIAGFAAETPLVATPGPELGAGEAIYLGNPARTSQVTGPGPREQPQLANVFELPADVMTTGQLLATEESVYLLGMTWDQADTAGAHDAYVLLAVDTGTGGERWRSELGLTYSQGEPSMAVADGYVFVAGTEFAPSREQATGRLLALDQRTGQEVWRFEYAAGGLAEPVVQAGVVYAGADDGSVVALDAATGAERWISDVSAIAAGEERRWRSIVAVNGDALYVAGGNHRVFALDPASGTERWRAETPEMTGAYPVVAGGRVFVVGYVQLDMSENAWPARRILALDAETGTELWRRDLPDDASVSAVIATEELVVIPHHRQPPNEDAELLAFDAATGAERWTFTGDQYLDEHPLLAAGIIYITVWDDGLGLPGPLRDLLGISSSSHLSAIDLATGTELWRAEPDQKFTNRVAVVGGKVYMVDEVGVEGDKGNTIVVFGDGTD